jgi:hypothetical protein
LQRFKMREYLTTVCRIPSLPEVLRESKARLHLTEWR